MFARKMFEWPGLGWQSPFTEIAGMRRQLDELSDLIFRGEPSRLNAPPGVFPLVNVTEDAGSYFVRAELPGLQAEDLNIQVTGKSLAIEGERRIPSEGEDVKYHRRERDAGRFSRIIALPGDIDPEGVEARMQNGMLSVTIPKSKAAMPRKITIQ